MRDELSSLWYAAQVRPRFEQIVAQQLDAKGYERFVPMSPLVRGRRTVDVPLVPGYVFFRVTGDAVGHVVTTPGVIRVVAAGRTWLSIPDVEIEALERIAASRMPAEAWTHIAVGQRVQIDGGPLDGLRGVLSRIGAHDRFIVTVEMLQRSVAVQIDRERLVLISAAEDVHARASGIRCVA